MGRKKVRGDFMFKLALLWIMHFGDIDPEFATCFNCEDYKVGVCNGGRDVIECMEEKAKTVNIIRGGIWGI